MNKANSQFHIFAVKRMPFTPEGKSVASLWKKADSFCEPFSMTDVKKSPVKSTLSMLYDAENLYVHTMSSCPASLLCAPGEKECKKPSFQLCLSLDKGIPSGERTFRIAVKGEPSLNKIQLQKGYLTQGGTCEDLQLPEVKIFSHSRESRSRFLWENNFVIPFSVLEREMPCSGESLNFTAFHHKTDSEWECIMNQAVFSLTDSIFSHGTSWLSGVFSEEELPVQCFSATGKIQALCRKEVITLCPEECKTTGYKNILGINNSPRIKMSRIASNVEKEQALFRQLGPARVRHHDAALCDPGFALIDVSRIFPLFRADHNDPENYDFAPTDLYLRYVAECGVPIEFRFGESIEHSERTFRVKPPADPEKWAQICVNILRHYKEGWHNGMKLDISYASVWEEPDGILLDGPYEKYLEMYEHFAKAVKKEFPTLRIGGPQTISMERIKQFLAFCKEKNLPVDFIAKTAYARDPSDFSCYAKWMRSIAQKEGFKDLEIFFAEWHYSPRSFKRSFPEDCLTMANAAFSLAAILRMQGYVDMAYYYLWSSPGYYGLFCFIDAPYKVYYALCLYTEFIRKNGKALDVKLHGISQGTHFLASVTETGTVSLLLARFHSMTETLEVHLPSAYKKCRMKIVSDTSARGERVKHFRSKKDSGCFEISFEEGQHGAYLLEFER